MLIEILRTFATKKVAEHDRQAMEHIRALMTCILWEFGEGQEPPCYFEAQKFSGFIIKDIGDND